MENPVHIAAYKALGIITTPIAFPELFTAMQQGAVDGQENPLSVIIASKFDQVQKHLSLTGHVYSPCVVVMNKAAFDKLSDADKQAFLDAAKEAVRVNRARVDADDASGVADLRAKGVTVVEDVDKTKFVAALVCSRFQREPRCCSKFLARLGAVRSQGLSLGATPHIWRNFGRSPKGRATFETGTDPRGCRHDIWQPPMPAGTNPSGHFLSRLKPTSHEKIHLFDL